MESNGSNTMTDNGAINDANSGSINQDEQIMLQKQVGKRIINQPLKSYYFKFDFQDEFLHNLISNLSNQAIDDEIKRTSKLIGNPEDLTSVQDEFKQDPVYLAKVINLGSKYSKIRRTRPDGNCFFRALAFAYFEKV